MNYILLIVTTISCILIVVLGLVIVLREASHRAALRRRVEAVQESLRADHDAVVLKLKQQFKDQERAIRKDAIKRSTAVVKGKVAEQLVPFSEQFGYNPRDVRFLGSPIDFIVFEGLTEGDLDRVVIVEVKTALSRLSKRERQVQDIVDTGEVYYEVLRV